MDMILILKLISYSHVLRNMRHYLNRAIEANHNKSDIDKLNDFFTSHEISSSVLFINIYIILSLNLFIVFNNFFEKKKQHKRTLNC